MIRRNVAANALGGGTAAVTAFLLIPVQIRQLGVEAYGLIGFLATLQVLFSLFDLGLSPAVTWYVARAAPDQRRTAAIVLGRVGPVYLGIGAALGLGLALAAPWLASDWLHLVGLPVGDAAAAIRLAGVSLMVRWPVSLLAGSLAGLQRFGPLNTAKGIHACVSFTGAVVVLFVWHDVVAFSAWLVASAALELALYGVMVSRSIAGRPRPAAAEVRLGALWRYAGTLAAISALSLILTQADRVMLARLVTTARLGEYVAAYNLLFGLSLIQLFVASAMYPSFATDLVTGDVDRIERRHHDATQTIMYFYALPFSLVVLFGEPVLQLFLAPDAARSTAPVLALLAIGFLFNALAAVPFSLAIAGGQSRLLIVVNAANLVWYLPALAVAIAAYGPVGAAAAWAALNVTYLVTVIPVVQRRLLGGGTLSWLRSAFVVFPVVALLVLAALRLVVGARRPEDPLFWLAILVGGLVYAVIGFRLLGPRLRAHARALLTPRRTGPDPIA